MADLIKTQHFTTQHEKILININFNPKQAVDPFAGACDLVNHFQKTEWELYDIDVKDQRVNYRDSLLDPIDYTNKTVITNPPYLAKNKTKEFEEVFKKYNTDDLYKASILSIIGCKNGILIIPINFFTDENTEDVRRCFLSKYKIENVNIFNSPVFENTTYNVCSFYFEAGKTDNVTFHNIDSKVSFQTQLKEEYGYRLGGDFYNSFKNIKPIFSRARQDKENVFLTNIFLTALDKRNELINLKYNEDIFYGKDTDRIYATLICKRQLSEEEQRSLIDNFNNFLLKERDSYQNLILTNYRDFGRKRISFDDVYKICTMLLENC